MVFLQYKGRIHRGKFTARSIRYILSDQAARLFPALQRRWLLPVESLPIAEAAREVFPFPSAVIEAGLPECHTALGISWPRPVQQIRRVYSVDDVVVTGWAGAMIKDGLLLTVRANHNWVSSLRAHPHRLRTLSAGRTYFNLMAPIPARGHMFHWLFDFDRSAHRISGERTGRSGPRADRQRGAKRNPDAHHRLSQGAVRY